MGEGTAGGVLMQYNALNKKIDKRANLCARWLVDERVGF